MAKDWNKVRFEDLRITADMDDGQIENVIRQRIEWRRNRALLFWVNLAIFIIVNAVIWSAYMPMAYRNSFHWPIFITFFWGVSMIKRGWALYQSSDRVQERREALIQAQVERARARLGRSAFYEKPKNDASEKRKNQPMQVGDDGEIVPLEELLHDGEQPRYQNNHRR
jgi:hypothetical protein